jgi:GTPase Era involved in 16S rRNA processing
VNVVGVSYIHRGLEIPRETVGMIIGHGGKKIKDLSAASGAKIQFKVRTLSCSSIFSMSYFAVAFMN